MDIAENKINLTILFSIMFIMGIISFFAQIQFFMIIISAVFVISLIYSGKIKILPAVIIFLSFLAGFYNADLRVKDSDELFYLAPRNNVVLEGQVVSIPETNKPEQTKFHFFVNKYSIGDKSTDNLKSKTIVTLMAPKEIYSKIQTGDTLLLKGNLRTPPKSSNPSEFSYAKYLQFENIFSAFFVQKDDFKIIKKPDKPSTKFLQKINNQRILITNKHSEILKSPYLELLGGVVFGYGAINPTDELKDSFRISGLLHLLAASGLNVGLIFSIWFFIGRIFKINYRLNIIIGSIFILIYTCMTGFSPSILRAAIMIEFVLFGKLIDRQADNLALISFVCFLMLLYNPSWICSVSFQLSFIVTTGLIIFMPVINEWVKNLNKIIRYVVCAISIPFIAQICVLPLQMFYFNTFSTYSVLANILVLPFITIVSFTGFVSSILAGIPFVPDIIVKGLDFVLNPFLMATVKISDFISTLPNANLITIQPNIFQVLFYYVLLLLIFKFAKDEIKNKKLLIFIIISVLLLLASFIKIPDKNLNMVFFSVRNADSCLVKTPNNHYFVIDTGKKGYNSNYSSGDAVIAKYLLSQGVRKIDFVILSHPDNDHIGGTVGLLKKIKAKKVFVNGNTAKTQTSKEVFDYLRKNKIPYEIVKNNSVLYEEENFKLRAYLNESVDDENENSIINLLEYKDFRALFMGDAGVDGYEVLPENTKIDVLKLGHHGAQGVIDKTAIEKIQPKTVIISTGLNQYGHPHYSIIDLLTDTNTEYLRTDDKNAIKITTDGKTITKNCYIPAQHKFGNCY